MNLYLVSRTDQVDYDEYDSLVVAHNTEEEALTVSIGRGWPGTDDLDIKLVGTAEDGIEAGTVILASFNAG